MECIRRKEIVRLGVAEEDDGYRRGVDNDGREETIQ